MERFFSKILRKNKITALIELGRPWNGLLVAFFAIMGSLLVTTQFMPIFLIAALVSFLIYLGGAALNDVFDVSIDFINMPFRPLERYQLKVKEALYFIFLTYLSAIIISLLISIEFFLISLLMIAVTYIYSAPPFSAKNKGILGNLVLAFGSVFTTTYAGYFLSTKNFNIPASILLPLTSLTILFAFFTILKDFKDIKGDKIRKKGTLAISIGIKNASLVNIIGTIIFFPLTIITFNSIIQNYLFVLSSLILFSLLLILELKFYKKPSSKNGEKCWSLSRIVMLFFTILLIYSLFLR